MPLLLPSLTGDTHCLGNLPQGLGCYGFDSHCEERYACADPKVCTLYKEPYAVNQCGAAGGQAPGLYQMPVALLFPKTDEASNLLVPVCNSASHVAYVSAPIGPLPLPRAPPLLTRPHTLGRGAIVSVRC